MDENIMNPSTFIKANLRKLNLKKSSSHEIQAGGMLYQISIVFCERLLPTIFKLAVPVAANVINNFYNIAITIIIVVSYASKLAT